MTVQRHMRAGVEHWRINISGFKRPDGSIVPRLRLYSPVNTRKAAEEYERKVRASLAEGSYGRTIATVPTFSGFMPEFLIEAGNNNKSSTVNTKRTLIDHHLEPFFGGLRLDEIDAAKIESFKAELRKKRSATHVRKENATKAAVKKRTGTGPKTLSDKSINNILTVLKRVLTLAIERKIIDHAPRVRLFRGTTKPGFDYLDFEEADRVIASSDGQWASMILTAIKTGLRTGELIGLQWNDLDLVRAKVHVRRTISKGVEGPPKGGRARTVDLPGSVVAALKALRPTSQLRGSFVWNTEKGDHVTEGQMKMPLARALRRAAVGREVGRIGWHDLRHTYGSHLAMRGVPLKAIQELMGHASIEMTMRYAHLMPAMKEHAVSVLDAPAPAGAR